MKNQKSYLTKRGFTLAELLTAAIIITVLVVIAVPLYEKTIERSHLAEARSILSRLQEAKLFAMDKMELDSYDPDNPKPTLAHLNVSFAPAADDISFNTKYFRYSLVTQGSDANPNAVCAERLGGTSAGTIFYYYHPFGGANSEFLCFGENCENVYGLDDRSADTAITCD